LETGDWELEFLFPGLEQNALRNLRSVAIKKSILFDRREFIDFQRNLLNFSNFAHSLDFFAYFLY